AALRDELRRSLPEYMVPDAVVVLPALPHTATGKIDRKTLPAPEYRAAESGGDVPQNETEAALVQVWEELLGVEGIAPTDDFFRVGGNSLLALRLFAAANRIFDCDLPVSTLFSGATVRHMAAAIDEQKRSGRAELSPVVPLRPAGSLPPLWCVHPADRRVFGYIGIGRHLGADQPLYGLRDVGEDLARPLPRIAAEYVEAMRAVQPRGPYYLAGWSFGGLVAYEMALRLEAAGEPVAFVGLLDTMAPAMAEEWPYDRDPWISISLCEDVAARMNRPFTFDVAEIAALEPDEQLRRVVESLRAQGAAPAGFGPERLAEQCAIIRARNRSKDGYLPGPFGGTLTVFLAGEVPARYLPFFARYGEEERRTLGWSRYTSAPVEVHDVPGQHASIGAEPHVRGLADHLRHALAIARARASRSIPHPTHGGAHG
ncbi:MAG TPA: thioesterase domain-containing protein, partial [Longimicrobiaceae bacterium]